MSKEKGHQVDINIVVCHLPRVQGYESGGSNYNDTVSKCWDDARDAWWHDLMKSASDECNLFLIKILCQRYLNVHFSSGEVEWMDAEDPLFMLYTSGSTGVPKGVLHTTAGYMLYAATTFKYSFDYQEGDVYWCTADIGNYAQQSVKKLASKECFNL